MNINDQIFYKAELLTKGMRASDNAKAILYKEFPDFFTKGIMHSLNVRFSETNCNVSIADDFAHESPYLLDEKDGNFFITDGKTVSPFRFSARSHTPARSWMTLQGFTPRVALRSGRTVIAVMTGKTKNAGSAVS